MTEFDFDELDKAVSSLMKDAEPAPTPSPSPSPAPAQENTTPPTVPTMPEQVSVEPPTSSTDPKPAVSPTPSAPKPTGRFMDVVHPSSDMRTPTPAPSREGNNLAPITPTPAPVQSSQPVTPTEEVLPAAPVNDVPLTSPFLPNTQVEKRPLGGSPEPGPSLDAAIAAELSTDVEPASTPAPTETVEMPVTPAEEPNPSEQTTEAPATPPVTSTENAPLPDELSKDLVNIESGEAKPEQQGVDLASELAQDTSPAVAQLSQSSIPQQYKEEDSTSDQTHVPIYDDQSTAQPLAHVPKKNGLKVIVIVTVIVLLGMAGAVALYFLQFGR